MVTLKGGLVVREDALQLAWSLEDRGHILTAQDGQLRVSRGSALTAEDRAAIPALRLHLLAIAGYKV